jgi:precorrin-2/cobalt-factor-2 C20-methyltransferase
VLKVIPAALEEERLRRELETADAVAIIKVAYHFDKVRRVLCDLGLANRAAIIERATQGDQRIARLTETKEGERPYFSTVLVYKGGERWR